MENCYVRPAIRQNTLYHYMCMCVILVSKCIKHYSEFVKILTCLFNWDISRTLFVCISFSPVLKPWEILSHSLLYAVILSIFIINCVIRKFVLWILCLQYLLFWKLHHVVCCSVYFPINLLFVLHLHVNMYYMHLFSNCYSLLYHYKQENHGKKKWAHLVTKGNQAHYNFEGTYSSHHYIMLNKNIGSSENI